MSTVRRTQNSSYTRTSAQKEYNRLKRLENQVVVHEIFVGAIDYAGNDEFWRNKLLLASRGKFTKNFFLRKNTICFKNNKNEIVREELGETPLEVYKTFTSFCRKHGRLNSDIDIEIEDNLAKNMDCEQKTQRGVSEIDLYQYLNLCKKEWGLEKAVFNSFQRCVFILIRLLGKKCIEYEDDQIVSFRGIVYNEEENCYEIDQATLQELIAKKKKNVQKNEPALGLLTSSHYKSKEEDFEDVLKVLKKVRKEKDLNEVINLAALDT